jgi:glycosyltransferase involved in cell wall biosynthesis
LRSLHICFVCSEYPPAPHGGIGSFVQTLGRALVERGHRVTAMGLYPEADAGRADDHGVHVVRISRRGLPVIRFATNRQKFARALMNLHARHPVDVLEGGELDISVLSKSLPGVKILRMHGGPTFFNSGVRIQVMKEKWAFNVADQLCAVSHCVAEGTRKALGLGRRHIEVIPNPVDLRLFAPKPDDMPEEEGLIVFAGTISERKGIRQLIEAMPRIVAEVPNARLEVYGGEVINPKPKVPLTPQLRAMLTGELDEHVIWKGRVPRLKLPQAIQRASVCVYPSHIEAMPIAWLEGLASGKAVVASETGPGPEIIDDGITGLLCDPHDADSIASALIRVLKDKELRRRLGANARRSAEERYALPQIVDRNETYYRDAISGRIPALD